ncbi:MAG: glycosyl transferase family 1 [Methylobacterium mesophilicum]|nr:glycosyl transferase family 1 [Methylobacterium mesophilicum]
MLHVLYLVHDLNDPAVRRRVAMLKAGGARVTLAGFHRGAFVPESVERVPTVSLGATADGRFAQRIGAVLKSGLSLAKHLAGVGKPDVILARNLEMLALGNRARRLFGADVPVVYECLDIHRLMLRSDQVGQALRWTERRLARDTRLLITSSPAFLREYFEPFKQASGPVMLVENKFLELEAAPPIARAPDVSPWRIGWFGALRCARSLDLLSRFTHEQGGAFTVTLRGKPALRELPDFQARVEAEPHLRFKGPYRNPEEMSAIYGAVHFSWAIDFFEEGGNSRWLLPNRLYEGCRFGAVPIAMHGTEIARVLHDRGIGLILPEATPQALKALLGAMTPERYAALRGRIEETDPSVWACTRSECEDLVARIAGRAATPITLQAAA